jgi:hypothetical protein
VTSRGLDTRPTDGVISTWLRADSRRPPFLRGPSIQEARNHVVTNPRGANGRNYMGHGDPTASDPPWTETALGIALNFLGLLVLLTGLFLVLALVG